MSKNTEKNIFDEELMRVQGLQRRWFLRTVGKYIGASGGLFLLEKFLNSCGRVSQNSFQYDQLKFGKQATVRMHLPKMDAQSANDSFLLFADGKHHSFTPALDVSAPHIFGADTVSGKQEEKYVQTFSHTFEKDTQLIHLFSQLPGESHWKHFISGWYFHPSARFFHYQLQQLSKSPSDFQKNSKWQETMWRKFESDETQNDFSSLDTAAQLIFMDPGIRNFTDEGHQFIWNLIKEDPYCFALGQKIHALGPATINGGYATLKPLQEASGQHKQRNGQDMCHLQFHSDLLPIHQKAVQSVLAEMNDIASFENVYFSLPVEEGAEKENINWKTQTLFAEDEALKDEFSIAFSGGTRISKTEYFMGGVYFAIDEAHPPHVNSNGDMVLKLKLKSRHVKFINVYCSFQDEEDKPIRTISESQPYIFTDGFLVFVGSFDPPNVFFGVPLSDDFHAFSADIIVPAGTSTIQFYVTSFGFHYDKNYKKYLPEDSDFLEMGEPTTWNRNILGVPRDTYHLTKVYQVIIPSILVGLTALIDAAAIYSKIRYQEEYAEEIQKQITEVRTRKFSKLLSRDQFAATLNRGNTVSYMSPELDCVRLLLAGFFTKRLKDVASILKDPSQLRNLLIEARIEELHIPNPAGLIRFLKEESNLYGQDLFDDMASKIQDWVFGKDKDEFHQLTIIDEAVSDYVQSQGDDYCSYLRGISGHEPKMGIEYLAIHFRNHCLYKADFLKQFGSFFENFTDSVINYIIKHYPLEVKKFTDYETYFYQIVSQVVPMSEYSHSSHVFQDHYDNGNTFDKIAITLAELISPIIMREVAEDAGMAPFSVLLSSIVFVLGNASFLGAYVQTMDECRRYHVVESGLSLKIAHNPRVILDYVQEIETETGETIPVTSFPPSADFVEVTLKTDGGYAKTLQYQFSPGIYGRHDFPAFSFSKVPLGGKATIQVTFYDSGACLLPRDQWDVVAYGEEQKLNSQSEFQNNASVSVTPNPHAINSHTEYKKIKCLAYDESSGEHVWASPAEVSFSNPSSNISSVDRLFLDSSQNRLVCSWGSLVDGVQSFQTKSFQIQSHPEEQRNALSPNQRVMRYIPKIHPTENKEFFLISNSSASTPLQTVHPGIIQNKSYIVDENRIQGKIEGDPTQCFFHEFMEKIYLFYESTARIQVLSPHDKGSSPLVFGGPGKRAGLFQNPSSIFVDGQGTIFVLEPELCRVQSFNPAGQLKASFQNSAQFLLQFESTQQAVPIRFHRLPDGLNYVLYYDLTDISHRFIKVYDDSGKELNTLDYFSGLDFAVDYFRTIYSLEESPVIQLPQKTPYFDSEGFNEPAVGIWVLRQK